MRHSYIETHGTRNVDIQRTRSNNDSLMENNMNRQTSDSRKSCRQGETIASARVLSPLLARIPLVAVPARIHVADGCLVMRSTTRLDDDDAAWQATRLSEPPADSHR